MLYIAECGAKCLGLQLYFHPSQRVDQWFGLHITHCVDKCVRLQLSYGASDAFHIGHCVTKFLGLHFC